MTLAAVALAQVAILQIKVTEGEGAVHFPGTRNLRPLSIEVTDETGRPVSGAAVSFHLPEEGPSGTFTNGLRTEIVITDSRGRASLHGLQANRVAGRFQVRILASKEQARAGIVSFQYVAPPKGGAAVAESKSGGPTAAPKGGAAIVDTAPSSGPGKWVAALATGHRKWAILAVGLAGGAVAGMIASRGGGSTQAGTAPVTVPVPPVTIGAPTITVGKP